MAGTLRVTRPQDKPPSLLEWAGMHGSHVSIAVVRRGVDQAYPPGSNAEDTSLAAVTSVGPL